MAASQYVEVILLKWQGDDQDSSKYFSVYVAE